MKLSICIPVYNFDVRELVYDLKKQITRNELDAEILLIDDASDEYIKMLNNELDLYVESFVQLEKNVGRSQIRNLFLYYSTGDYLLFLDCDGKVIDKNFVKSYVDFITENPQTKVIYGGRVVSDEMPETDFLLRWKFAKERENLGVEARRQIPYLSFQTNNFVVKRAVLKKVNFNPQFQKYGYEDLLFAMDLKAQNTEIQHIENPIFNNDLESNEVYLKKVEESVESLRSMIRNKHIYPKIQDIKLVKVYKKFKETGADFAFRKLFGIRKKRIAAKLLSGQASLRYLDFYKLGLLLEKE